MALDVTLSTWDADIDVIDTLTLRNVKYTMRFDRGVKIFRLRMLKVFEDFFKLNLGHYMIPPVVSIDGGSTLWTLSLECYLRGNPAAVDGPVDDVEKQIMAVKEFIELKSYLALRTHLKIGAQLVQTGDEEIHRPGEGFEGKIMNGAFEWISDKYGIVKFTFDFVGCIDLSWF